MIYTFIAERCSDLPVSACCRVMKVCTVARAIGSAITVAKRFVLCEAGGANTVTSDLAPNALTRYELRGRGVVRVRFTAAVVHEGEWFVARALEVEVTSQGRTIDEALANLREALELCFEDEAQPVAIEPPVIAAVQLSA